MGRTLDRVRMAAVVMGVTVGVTFAHQNGPARGTHITVAKAASDIGGYTATYSTVQAAVNAAKPGQVIEILDEAEYAEQVTIDGMEDRQWPSSGAGQPAPVGGKSGITIKYAPPAGAAVGARPVIRWKDTQNQSPKTYAESQVYGHVPGTSGNFETCAALRVLHTSGITIEGIIVDGGGSAPFAWPNVWDMKYPLFHGNSAIALVYSGNVQIRDCETRNAYFGVYAKDRNTGGVFANPNLSDIDVTVPLSGFGKSGNHLIEYNKIHDNDVGIYFESSWDLGSTVRYNLIYGNYHKTTTVRPAAAEGGDWASGAILFKDNYLSPVAIYNNTLYDNTMHLIGNWQVGYQHLIFNNIFSKPHAYGQSGEVSYMGIEGMFPNRMKHCVFAADSITSNGVAVLFNNLKSPTATGGAIAAGSLIPGGGGMSAVAFPTDANVRWLETAGGSGLDTLFVSLNPASPDFLNPKWTHASVQEFIRNKGWPGSGITNEDGTVANLGAIPYSGKRPCDGVAQTSRARVSPFSVVAVNGTTATVGITVNQEIGSLNGLSIKYLRWIVPIPNNTDSYGSSSGNVVPAASIRNVSVPAGLSLSPGPNRVSFTVPALGAADTVGFFELVLEGKDGIGRTVTTDVGFLPYRRADDYYLDIKVLKNAAPVTEVAAGEPVTLRVTAMNRATGEQFTGGSGAAQSPINIAYSLVSSSASCMYLAVNNALAEDNIYPQGGAYTKDYTVYFTKAGSEVISGAGLWCDGGCASEAARRVPFLGNVELKVLPGTPDKVAFLSPVSSSQLGDAPPPIISGAYSVEAQVYDRYGNPVDVAVPMNMTSTDANIGSVTPQTAATDPATGIAAFTAQVTNGAVGDVFGLVAMITYSGATVLTDNAKLRVGRPPVLDGPPRVVAGGYATAGDVIKSVNLTFDRNASHDWFASMEFAFGDMKATLANMACVTAGSDDAKRVSVDFGCAFPGIGLPAALAANSVITINISGKYGWEPLTVTFVDGAVSVLEPSRNVPQIKPKEEAAVIAPAVILSGEFTAGPNPVSKSSGIVNFFRQGRRVQNAELRIYDANGNVINKIKITDNAINTQARRKVGSWDLKDRKGRLVPEGTYLVKGVLKTSDGKAEKVSVVLGVR